jgi:uncharacterized protein Usg
LAEVGLVDKFIQRGKVGATGAPFYRYRLTTAEILYFMPDYPDLLQSYTWQHIDLAPDYPDLKRFLAFWEENLDGRIHSVKVGTSTLDVPHRRGSASHHLTLH